MTTEEKAKAYDEALERAKKQRADYQKELDKTDKNSQLAGLLRTGISAIDMAFPELKESEDERMRKEIISALKFANDGGVYDKHIAYLEKQKEQKPMYALAKDQYVEKFRSLCDSYEIKLPNRIYDIYHLCDDLSELFIDSDKHKSAEWSEDESIRKSLIAYLKGESKKLDTRKWITYLEKLKEYPTNGEMLRTLRAEYEKGVADTITEYEQKERNCEDEEDKDFTIYHPLKNEVKGEYECFPYSFYGSLTSFSENKDLIDFLRNCFYTEEECNKWIEQQKEQKQKCSINFDPRLNEFEACMLRYLQSAANRRDDNMIIIDTKGYAAQLMEIAKKDQKPLSTEETELNSLAFLEQMGYTCVPPEKEQKPAECLKAERDGWYVCTKDYYRGGRKQCSIGDLVQAKGGMYMMGEEDISEWFRRAYYEEVRDRCSWIPGPNTNTNIPQQEWSEEDKRILKGIIGLVDHDQHYDVSNKEMLTWLKFLPERFSLQSKQEWSEEDKRKLELVIDCIYEYYPDPVMKYKLKDWLKFLPEKFNLQLKVEWNAEDYHWEGLVQWLRDYQKTIDRNSNNMAYEDIESYIDWVNQIRFLHPQPKTKLTILDENIIDAAIAFVEQNDHFNCWRGIDKHTVIKALRSLCHTWKPSEEQMKALESLYEQLKKLM